MPDPSTGSETRQVVLLIDEDPKSVRLVRLSLHGPTCNVLTATRHLEGLRLAARQKPQLILMETRFKGMDGFHLAGKLLQAPETQGSAIAFLTEDGSFCSRLRGIQLGAAEYIHKPVDGRQLATRIGALFARLARGRTVPPQGHAVTALVELARRVEEGALSGTLSLQRGSQASRIRFVQGAAQESECGPLRGEEALNEIASHGDWSLSFEEEEGEAAAPLRRRRTSDETRPELIGKPVLPRKTTPAKPPPTEPTLRPGPRTPPAPDRPEPPTARPVKHLPSTLTATVHDSAVAQPRLAPRPSFEPEPGLAGLSPFGGEEEEDRTVVDPNQRSMLDAITQPGQEAPVPEIVIPRFDSTVTDQGSALPPAAIPKPALPSTLPLPEAEESSSGHDQESSTLRRGDFGEPGEGFDEDIPTSMSFKLGERSDTSAPDGSLRFVPSEDVVVTAPTPAIAPRAARPQLPVTGPILRTPSAATGPGAPATPPPKAALAPRPALRGYLEERQATLLIVAPPTAERARAPLQQAAEELGFVVQHVATGLEAYRFALERRPTAVLSDLRGPELDGRELLAAIRSDFCVRETPFIMVSSEYLASQLQLEGIAGLAPIVSGLEAALAPRVTLEERARTGGELSGFVEPVGLSYLLRTIGGAGLSGRLQLNTKEGRGAVVFFRRGALCGATVNAAQATVGPMAMLHLLGYEWQEFVFVPEVVDSALAPLGELEELIETSFQQNNMLLTRVYQQGVQIEDVSVDSNALDHYLQRLPAGSLELLIRLVEGEKAAVLAEKNVAAPGLLKSILHDLRRKAVIQPLSMKPAKLEERVDLPASPSASPAPPVRRRRWLVVLIACLVTVLLSAGGYFAYFYLYLGGRLRF